MGIAELQKAPEDGNARDFWQAPDLGDVRAITVSDEEQEGHKDNADGLIAHFEELLIFAIRPFQFK